MISTLIERLESLHEMMQANANADWSENDPNEEFKALAEIVKGHIPTERDLAIERLSHIICDEDVEAAYDRLIAQQEIDGSVDACDYVTIWQPFENDGLTVDEVLSMEI